MISHWSLLVLTAELRRSLAEAKRANLELQIRLDSVETSSDRGSTDEAVPANGKIKSRTLKKSGSMTSINLNPMDDEEVPSIQYSSLTKPFAS